MICPSDFLSELINELVWAVLGLQLLLLRLSSACKEGLLSRCRAPVSPLQWFLLLASTGSRHAGFVEAVAPGSKSTGSVVLRMHRLSCSVACGALPDQGIEPVSPALAGGFFTTRVTGEPLFFRFFSIDETDHLDVPAVENQRQTGLFHPVIYLSLVTCQDSIPKRWWGRDLILPEGVIAKGFIFVGTVRM